MDNFLGEVRIFAGSRVPEGWHACDGTLLSVADNEALYSLLGTRYGGDGKLEFGLPNLVARVPIGCGKSPAGDNYPLGIMGGSAEVTLTEASLTAHTHPFRVTTRKATKATPDENPSATVLAAPDTAKDLLYIRPNTANTAIVTLAAESVSSEGNGNPHPNLMPTFSLRYIIAVVGNFPTFN